MVNCVKAADISSKMSTEDLEAALASLRASVTESRAVSVEWLLLNNTKVAGLIPVRASLFCSLGAQLCSSSKVTGGLMEIPTG